MRFRACLKIGDVPGSEGFWAVGKQFFAGIPADFKEKLRRQGSKDPPIGHVDIFQTSPILADSAPERTGLLRLERGGSCHAWRYQAADHRTAHEDFGVYGNHRTLSRRQPGIQTQVRPQEAYGIRILPAGLVFSDILLPRACLKNVNMSNRRGFCPLDGAIFP